MKVEKKPVNEYNHAMTHSEIAKDMGVSRQMILLIEKQAIAKMKAKLGENLNIKQLVDIL